MQNRPYYHKLYADMIRDKYPEKASLCTKFLKKEDWIALDVIHINNILFSSSRDKSDVELAKKHRAYDTQSILKILQHQRENKLNDSIAANEFGISRNTLRKWKIAFKDEIESLYPNYIV